MKKITFLILGVLLSTVMFSQLWNKNLPENKSVEQLTFFDYQNAFNEYWASFNVDNKGYYIKDGKKIKASGWKQFNRWQHNMEGQIDKKTGEFPKKSAQQIYDEFYKSNPLQKSTNQVGWTSLGPNSSSGGYSGLGRVNCVAFHPTDNNTYWVGTPSGGLFLTTNNGSSWTCLTDNNYVLGVSDIVITSDYATSKTIYIATGDKDATDNSSIGVLKSTDGGLTWNTTGLVLSIANRHVIYRLLLDPNDNNTIISASSIGVYKTINGGDTWNTRVTINRFTDMEYKPGDFNTLYGSMDNGKIYVTTNGGTNWTLAYTNTAAARIELAVSPANANYVYALASADADNGFYGLYQSTNSGTSFTQKYSNTAKNLLGWDRDGNDSGGQGWYDLALDVSPTNANIVLVGGVNTWRSTNGGSIWTLVAHWTGDGAQDIHADQHMIKYRSNGDLFECNDGGIYLSTSNGDNFIDKTNGLSISQMYKLGVSQTVSTEIITGLQDNGTKLLKNGNWNDVKGGDGMNCIIDYSNVNIQYGSYAYGQITRTTNGWTGNYTDIEPSNAGDGAWITPYIIDPVNHNTLYAGYSNVWKSTNNGTNWTQISNMNSVDKLTSMAIAPSNNSVLYVADNSHIWKTIDGGSNWTSITSTLPVSNVDIEDIAVKADDENTLWVVFSGYNQYIIYESLNGGTSWSNISTGLPSLPAYSIVQNKQITDEVHLYIGTELGVYFKKGSEYWVQYNTDLPNVKIGEIEIYYDSNPLYSKLRAATYGRGLWENELYDEPCDIFYYNIDESVNVCSGESFVFPDQTTQTNITSQVDHTSNLLTINGCDSIINTTVIVNVIDTSVSLNTMVLSANMIGATYQWLDCANGYSIIADQTNKDFSVTENGNYAVEITSENCVDTSNCHTVVYVGVIENSFEESIILYPNPTSGNIIVKLGKSYSEVTFVVKDITGQKVYENTFEATNEINYQLTGANGFYIVEITSTQGNKAIVKVIKN